MRPFGSSQTEWQLTSTTHHETALSCGDLASSGNLSRPNTACCSRILLSQCPAAMILSVLNKVDQQTVATHANRLRWPIRQPRSFISSRASLICSCFPQFSPFLSVSEFLHFSCHHSGIPNNVLPVALPSTSVNASYCRIPPVAQDEAYTTTGVS